MYRDLLDGLLPERGGLRVPPGAEPDGVYAGASAEGDARFVVEPHESIRAAAQRMVEDDLSCLVVVTSGVPRGLLLDWSLVVAVLCLQLDGEEPVDTIRWHPFVSAREGGRTSEAAWLMESHAIRDLPVSNGEGRIIGVLAIEDAFARVLDELTSLAAATHESVAATSGRDRLRRGASLRARDVQGPVLTLDASASARAVAERLCASASDALVVLDGQRPLGIVSERALLARFVADGASPTSVLAGDLVERPFACVAAEDPVDEILAQMRRSGLRRIVVGGEGGCSGMVTLRDLISRLVLELASRLPREPGRRDGGAAALLRR